MRTTLFAMLLCCGCALSAQDSAKKRVEAPVRSDGPKTLVEAVVKDRVPDLTKSGIEFPVRKIARSPKPEKYDLSKTGITWHEGIDAVLDKRRPILLFQLLGQFDDVYC